MQVTDGEAITTALRLTNVGGEQYRLDQPARDHARYLLSELGGRVWTLAPHWWRTGSSPLVIDANVGSGGMPSDFSNIGKQGNIYVSGKARSPLAYIPPDDFFALLHTENNPKASEPTAYTLHTTSGGTPILYIYPINSADVTLDIENYNRRVPEFVDIPIAPVVAVGAAGNPNGNYAYRITFIMGTGETEGGFPSASIALANKKGELSQVPVSPARSVTGRAIYKPAAGAVQYKLVGSLNDNLTTDFTDDILDINLGVPIPTPAVSVGGMAQYPGDFHEVVMVRGLINLLRGNQGDGREQVYGREWDRWVKTMWADQRQGQNVIQVMPRYGAIVGAGAWTRPRSRFRGI